MHEHLQDDDAEAPDVRALVAALHPKEVRRDHLWSLVVGRAAGGGAKRALRGDAVRETKVRQGEVSVGRDEDVLGLDVEMYEAHVMQFGHCTDLGQG